MDPDQYFDHLLTYNMVREKNIIHKDEFERVFQLEKFDFSVPELNSLFKFFDFKNDGFIDRQEFVRTLKNIPYPITTFHNFIKNTKLSIEEACYKMGIDLFSGRVENELKNKINRQSFNLKVKNLSNTFDKEFLYSLYNAMNVDNKHYITVKQLIDYTNIYGDEDYKNINSSLVHKEIITVIQNSISFDGLKNKFEKIDLNITQKLPLDKFITTLKEAVNNKINDKNLIRFLRMHRLIDFSNIVSYHQFIMIVYDNYIEDVFMKVIEIFKNFLETECNNDLFLFLVKINNMCNSSSMKRTVEAERLYAFFRPKLDYLSLGMINRFDYNNDGVISFEDLENIIKKYIDPHFFDNKKEIMMKLENDNKKKVYDGNKRIWNLIKIATNKMNLTDEKLFYFLDKNKDTFIGKIEFLEQIPKLKLPTKLTQKQLLAFYNYLDDFMNEKVNINIFLKKFKIFETDNIENDEQIYKGNFVIENILLGEFAKWYNRNMHLSDTEIYSILDRDNDGIISSDDIKNFAINILRLAGNELNDLNILHFMNVVSYVYFL
jgi:Ca2+-binding EF-hand superfamily protein